MSTAINVLVEILIRNIGTLAEPAYLHIETSINKQNIFHNRVDAGVSTNHDSRILSTRMRCDVLLADYKRRRTAIILNIQ